MTYGAAHCMLQLARRLMPYGFLLAIVLAGHFGALLGHGFFVEEDPVSLFAFAAQNSRSDGWIASEALGASRFHGDPGAHHIWSPWSFWHRLFSDQVLAYNSSIVVLLCAAALAQLFLIRRMVPALAPVLAALLACLLIFSPLRYEYFFQRHWIMLTISAPLALLVLHDFCRAPAPRHFFQLTVLFFLALVLGSAGPFTHLGALCVFLAIAFGLVRADSGAAYDLRNRLRVVLRMLALVIASAGASLVLDAWELYTIFLEKAQVGYVRDPNYVTDGAFAAIPALKDLLNWGASYFHSGWLSPWMASPGVPSLLPAASWKNVSPLFPVVLLILLANRQRTGLERVCLLAVIFFFVYDGLLLFLPGLSNSIQSLLALYPLERFEPAYQTYQVALIACVVARLNDAPSLDVTKAARVLAGALAAGYLALLAVFAIAAIKPDILLDATNGITRVLAEKGAADEISLAIVDQLARQHVSIWREQGNLFQYGFLMLTAFGSGFLAFRGASFLQRSGVLAASVACVLVLTNLLLALAVYPLNKDPLVWDANRRGLQSALPELGQARVTRVGVPCLAGMDSGNVGSYVGHYESKRKDWKECILRKLQSDPRYLVGYTLIPALELSAVKSFTQRDVAEWVLGMLRAEGIPITQMRSLTTWPPLYESKVYDMAAVKYLVSNQELPPRENLVPRYRGKQFFIYENLRAWDPIFLADRVAFTDDISDMAAASRHHAFLPASERDRLGRLADDSVSAGKRGQVQLLSTRDGHFELSVEAGRESLLVIADAWHPQWIARVDGQVAPVLKVNGAFKGVVVPAGQHRIVLSFDTTPYGGGIIPAVIAMLVFLAAWIITARRRHPA